MLIAILDQSVKKLNNESYLEYMYRTYGVNTVQVAELIIVIHDDGSATVVKNRFLGNLKGLSACEIVSMYMQNRIDYLKDEARLGSFGSIF